MAQVHPVTGIGYRDKAFPVEGITGLYLTEKKDPGDRRKAAETESKCHREGKTPRRAAESASDPSSEPGRPEEGLGTLPQGTCPRHPVPRRAAGRPPHPARPDLDRGYQEETQGPDVHQLDPVCGLLCCEPDRHAADLPGLSLLRPLVGMPRCVRPVIHRPACGL